MRSRNWFGLFAIIAALSGGLHCDGGDDNTDCTGPYADPCACWGECGDADGDVRPDSDAPATLAPLRIETWTLSPDGVPYDIPGAEAEVNGQRCTTPCDLQVPTGTHSLYLRLAGWVQGPHPLEINVATNGVAVNGIPTSIVEVSGSTVRHRLEKEVIAGVWKREGDEYRETVRMFIPRRLRDHHCPNTLVGVGSFSPLGELCVEGETLSLQNPCPRVLGLRE